MAISLSSLRRSASPQPPRLLLYGVHGFGKSTIAASAPAPVYLQTEDAAIPDIERTLGREVAHWPVFRTLDEVMEAVISLYNEKHDFKSVILDSVDWLEPLVWAGTCAKNNWASIEEPGFGKGYLAAQETWRELLEGLSALRDERGMTVIFITHADVKKFDSPDAPSYDRYLIKLQQRASALLQEHVDAVLFANYRLSIVRDQGKGDKRGEGRARAVGSGQRVIHTTERPAFLAKNRFGMPDQIVLPDDAKGGWAAIAAAIPFFQEAANG